MLDEASQVEQAAIDIVENLQGRRPAQEVENGRTTEYRDVVAVRRAQGSGPTKFVDIAELHGKRRRHLHPPFGGCGFFRPRNMHNRRLGHNARIGCLRPKSIS